MSVDTVPASTATTVPHEWAYRPLSPDVSVNPESLHSGTDPSRSFRYIDISAVNRGVVDWNAVTTQTLSSAPSRARRVVRPEDVLLCTVRPGLQAHTLADWPGNGTYICSTGFAVLRPGAAVDSRFLYHVIFSDDVSRQLQRLESGSNYPAVNEADVNTLNIPLPPVIQQRRIAEVLDTIDATIQQTGALIAKLKVMKAGLLHDLLTRGLDGEGRLRDAGARPGEFRDTRVGSIPREWQVLTLGSVAEIGSGVTLGRDLAGPGTVELPYLRVANVQDAYVDLSEVKKVRVPLGEVPKYLLRAGDVLMNEGGDFDKLGRGTVWRGQVDPCLHQNHVFRVRVDHQKLLPEYLAAVSGSAYGKRFFVLSSKQSTNLASVNSTQLKAFPIPCPPITEQVRILKADDANEARIQDEVAYRDKLRHVKQGLMDDLLTGRTRVENL